MRTRTAYLLGLVIIIFWGVSFVSTRVLLDAGQSPASILWWRLAVAWLALTALSPRPALAANARDEVLMLALGILGGTGFFIFQNHALRHTLVSNAGLLICTVPIMTALVGRCCGFGTRLSGKFWLGSGLALTGSSIVVYTASGGFAFRPWGDLLILCAALSWALYSNLLKPLSERYNPLFLTRNMTFYGALTTLPLALPDFGHDTLSGLLSPVVLLNLLFLALICHLLCFWLWNLVVDHVGPAQTSNLIYLQPIVTVVSAIVILGEPFSPLSAVGTAVILTGVALSDRALRA